MKIQVTMKDPDALYDAVNDAVDEDLKASGLDQEEQDAIRDIRREKHAEVVGKWFRYGEYLTVEIDTDEKTIRVLEDDE